MTSHDHEHTRREEPKEEAWWRTAAFLMITVILFGLGAWVGYQFYKVVSIGPLAPLLSGKQASRFSVEDILNITLPNDGYGTEPVITFADGRYEYSTTVGKGDGAVVGAEGDYYVSIFKDTIRFGDVNGDRKSDAVFVTGNRTGGTGLFEDLYVMMEKDGKLEMAAKIGLGDRVLIKAVKIRNQEIILDLLTHDSGEPMCCPATPKTVSYKLVGSELEEVGSTSNWKTYRNEEYGFEFKYPPKFIIERSDDFQDYILIAKTVDATEQFYVGHRPLSDFGFKDTPSGTYWGYDTKMHKCYSEEYNGEFSTRIYEDTTIQGFPLCIRRSGDAGEGGHSYVVMIEDKGLGIFFSTGFEAYTPLQDIVSTFRPLK